MIVVPVSHNEPEQFATLPTSDVTTDDKPACLIRLMARALGMPMAALLVMDDHQYRVHIAYGLPQELPPHLYNLVTRTTLHPLIIPDTHAELCYGTFNTPHVRFYAGLPLFQADGTQLGTLFVADNQPRDFDEDGHSIIHDTALLITDMILARQATAKKQREDDLIALMHGTALALGRGLATTELLTTIVRRATMFFGTVRGFLYLREADEPVMTVRVGVGYLPEHLFAPIAPGEGLAGTVWQEGRPIVVDDYAVWHKRLIHDAYDTMHAVIGVPLVIDNTIIGVLGLTYDDTHRHFDAADIETLSRFAQLASIAINNARLFSRLQQSEERYRNVVNNVKEVIFQIDQSGRWTFLNPAWEEALGYPVADTLGTPCLNYVHPDDVALAHQLAHEVITQQRSAIEHEIRFITKDGQICWMMLRGELRLNKLGKVIGGAGTLADISKVRRAIQQTVAAQTEIEVLTQADALKTKFMAVVAHELRAPLTSIMGFAELLTLHNDAPHLVQAYSHNIITSAERIRAMIDEYLNLQRIEAGVEEFTFSLIDVGALLRETIAHLHTYGHPIKLRLARTACIRADRAKLRRVIENLVSNAIKYSPEATTITISIREHDEQIELRVRDRGVGIPPEAQPHIFQKYYRAKTDVPGTGLGLAISKEIVERHGGCIGFESQKLGTTFWVRLPRS